MQVVALRRSTDQLVGPGVLHTTGLACADSDSLEHKHCGRQPPAPIELTDLIFGWHTNVGEIGLVEPHAAVDLINRTDPDPGRMHVNDEHRDAAVVGLTAIGASNDNAPVSNMGIRS